MFIGIAVTGDKAWAPFLGTLPKKTLEAGTSHFKIGRKKFSKQIEGAVRLSSQIEKLCSATNNMSQATSSLTLIMDPYGIPQTIKLLDSLSEEVPGA
ncbi:hypothetical protein Goklo_026435, partial [Gossypium klotzschianum]|nr:hypothetical protein [Gossypium klotzschianum]